MSQLPANAVFTLRDLNRQPAKVLEAVRKFGSAEVRTRSGEVFTLTAKPKSCQASTAENGPDFLARWQRLRDLGYTPPVLTEDENERLNALIAGEE